jgi:hypothetical protein
LSSGADLCPLTNCKTRRRLPAAGGRPVGETLEEDDVLVILLHLARELVEAKFKAHPRQFLVPCRAAMALETALGWSPRQLLPQYDVTAPRNAAEAIEQGERIAAQERQRIGMGAPWPVENVSALVYSQWVRTIPPISPDNVTGLAVHHRSIRPAVLVNRRHRVSARRFSLTTSTHPRSSIEG